MLFTICHLKRKKSAASPPGVAKNNTQTNLCIYSIYKEERVTVNSQSVLFEYVHNTLKLYVAYCIKVRRFVVMALQRAYQWISKSVRMIIGSGWERPAQNHNDFAFISCFCQVACPHSDCLAQTVSNSMGLYCFYIHNYMHCRSTVRLCRMLGMLVAYLRVKTQFIGVNKIRFLNNFFMFFLFLYVFALMTQTHH